MKIIKQLLLALTLLALPHCLHADSLAGKTQQLTSPDQVPQGLAKTEWAIIRAAYEAGRHALQPIASGWQARNPGHGCAVLQKCRAYGAGNCRKQTEND